MTVAQIFDTLDYGPAPEAATIANAWLDARNRKTALFIGGAWQAPAEGGYFESINPATAKPLAQIAQATATDIDAAVAAARAAQKGWAKLGGPGRARFLYALARMVQKHARLFAVLETIDNGKPIRETRDIDIPLVARHFYHHAGWAQLIDTEFPNHEPIGVVGQIIPWNFPLLMLSWKIAPALAAGNTVVLKPAEFTSLTAILFAEICLDAGLPPGVVAAAIAAVDLFRSDPEFAAQPLRKARAFTKALGLKQAMSPIVPIILGSTERTMEASRLLQDEGFLVIAIRPPTVPDGTARLRVTFSAAHEDADISRLVDIIKTKILPPS